MARPNVQTRSGNRTLLYMDNILIGAAQDASLDKDFAPEPVYGIGDIDPIEFVPTRGQYRVSVSQMVLNKKSLLSLGLIPENGEAALAGLVFDIVKIDKNDSSVLCKYVGCSYASGNVQTRANGITMISGQFNALTVQGTGL